ncbi:hypothetical protein DMENIID0001_070490 [Sergentomyia squamirostris]
MTENTGGKPPEPLVGKKPIESYEYRLDNVVKYPGYKVVIAKEGETASPFDIKPLIKDNFKSTDIRFKSYNRRRTTVFCNSAKIANELAKDTKLREAGFNAYIPLYYAATAHIVWNVDPRKSEEWILNNITAKSPTGANIKILKVFRMKRKILKDGTPEWIDANRVKVYIEGQDDVPNVLLDDGYIMCDTSRFVRKFQQCNNCFKFNHTAKTCKKGKICKSCGCDFHTDSPCQSQKCAGCGGTHPTASPNCPEKLRQRNINEAMSKNMLSWDEANEVFPKKKRTASTYASVASNNPFAILQDLEDDFPALPTHEPPPPPPPSVSTQNKRKPPLKTKGKFQGNSNTTFRGEKRKLNSDEEEEIDTTIFMDLDEEIPPIFDEEEREQLRQDLKKRMQEKLEQKRAEQEARQRAQDSPPHHVRKNILMLMDNVTFLLPQDSSPIK